jgi:hypothetical protein
MLFFVSSWDFADLCVFECLNNLMLGLHGLMKLNPSSLFILFGCKFTATASLAGHSSRAA